MSQATIRDEDLHAFIDGELEDADRARVDAAVNADPALGEQVAAFRADKARLVSLYGGGLNEPLPRPSNGRDSRPMVLDDGQAQTLVQLMRYGTDVANWGK